MDCFQCGDQDVNSFKDMEETRPEKRISWTAFTVEIKKLGLLGVPMIVVTLAQFLLPVISMMMVGHLGELVLSSTAIALSLASVTGFNLLVIFRSRLERLGAAVAIGISYWLNAIVLGLYMKYSSTCKKTLAPISMELFQGIGEFFRFATPSAMMICLEYWSFELLVLLSGHLPNPKLETSVLSICTRVSNELGAGNPQGARVAIFAVLFLAVTDASIVGTTLIASRHIFGYTFSNEKEVVNYVASMAPLISLSVVLDSILGVFSGVARGSGWQHIVAYVNLPAYYLCGIPIAIASKARERIFEGRLPRDNNVNEEQGNELLPKINDVSEQMNVVTCED
uniref:Uncharacterized protein n=1 Tax=Fagus sylvatica TaxID=28930 RepID=A0A2N9IID8_FAGSY